MDQVMKPHFLNREVGFFVLMGFTVSTIFTRRFIIINKALTKNFALMILFCFFIVFTSANYGHAGIYKYKDKDGNWHFTDYPPSNETIKEMDTVSDEQESLQNTDWDLEKQLYDKLKPKNEIEKAVICTVSIKTPFGQGSGFFIDKNGSILTNRHVIERDTKGDRTRLTSLRQHLKREIEAAARFYEQLHKVKVARAKIAYNNTVIDLLRISKSPRHHDQIEIIEKYNQIEIRKFYDSLSEQNFKKMVKEYNRRKRSIDKIHKELKNYEHKTYPAMGYVTIILADNSQFEAEVVTKSDQNDLALLKLSRYKTPFLVIDKINKISTGDPVYAIGNPFGLSHSVTSGIFSGYRTLKNVEYIQTDAQINQGNSGGPLINKKGRVLGINTIKMVGKGVEGISFAIPIKTALDEFERHLQ